MAETRHDLSLVVSAKDGASAVLSKIGRGLKALADTKNPVRGALSGVSDSASKLGSAIGRMVALPAAAAVGLGVLTNGSIEAGGELAKMAERLGVTATWYATYSKAAEIGEVAQEEFSQSLTVLAKNLGLAKAGTGPALAALAKISPVLAAQFAGAKSTQGAFTLLSKALAKIPDPARRIALATTVMGKGAVNMARWMGQGTDEIQRQAAEVFKLIGAQEEFAQNADDTGDELLKTKIALEGLRNGIVGAFLPALKEVSQHVTKYFADNREGIKQWAEKAGKAISQWVADGGLKRLGAALGKIADGAQWLCEKLGPLGTALLASSPLWGPVAVGVASLAASMVTLGIAVGWPVIAVGALGAAVLVMAANWDKLKTLPILSELDMMLQLVLRLTSAIRELTGASAEGGAPGATVETPRQATERAAQGEALATVGRVAGVGLREGAISAMPIVGPILGLIRAGRKGTFADARGAAPVGAAPRGAGAGEAPAQAAPAKAEVQVKFTGAPPGMRVDVAPGSTAEVDVSTGPSITGL